LCDAKWNSHTVNTTSWYLRVKQNVSAEEQGLKGNKTATNYCSTCYSPIYDWTWMLLIRSEFRLLKELLLPTITCSIGTGPHLWCSPSLLAVSYVPFPSANSNFINLAFNCISTIVHTQFFRILHHFEIYFLNKK